MREFTWSMSRNLNLFSVSHATLGLAVVLGLLVAGSSNAQDVEFGFIASAGSSTEDGGRAIALDGAGNVYTTGVFSGTVSFGSTTLTSGGNVDIFVHKMNSGGGHVWAKRIGGASNCSGNSIAVDGSGNVYLTGSYIGNVDFDPGPGGVNFNSPFGNDFFVLKLDAGGNYLWVRTTGGTGEDVGVGIAVDVFGSVYTTGYFTGTVDFDPSGMVIDLAGAGGRDVFVQKLDADGNYMWATAIGGSGDDENRSIAVDVTGNVYIGGGAGQVPLVTKLDADGDVLWAQVAGGTGGVGGAAIAVDLSGVYTAGNFSGTVDLNPGMSGTTFTSQGDQGIYVQKFDVNGNPLWTHIIDGPDTDSVFDIALDRLGNVYTTGYFRDVLDFDPGVGEVRLSSGGSTDVYVNKLDSGGNFAWARSFSGPLEDSGDGIGVDGTGNIYTTGYFQSAVDFNPGDGAVNVGSAGGTDIFVHKLDAHTAPLAHDDAATTDEDSVISTNAPGDLFWTSLAGGEILMGTTDGTGPTTIVSELGSLEGIAIDGLNDKLYFSDTTSDTLYRSDLDGNNVESIAKVGIGRAVAIDYFEGVLYVADETNQQVAALDLATSGVAVLASGLDEIASVAVDPVNRKVYWADLAGALIGRADLDGSNPETVLTDPAQPLHMYVDGASGRLYYTTNSTNALRVASTGTGRFNSLGSPFGPFTDPIGVHVDRAAHRIFVTDSEDGELNRYEIVSGSGGILFNGLSSPSQITQYQDPRNLLFNDGDVNNDGIDTVVEDVMSAQGVIVIINADGTYTYDPTGNSALQALDDGESLVDSFTYTLTDGSLMDTATVSITVNGVDDPEPAISIGVPSASTTAGGPVTFTIDYANAAEISLAHEDITLNTTGSATGDVALTGSGLMSRLVTISNITGNGSLGISVTADTAVAIDGDSTPSAGPSGTFEVDNTSPVVTVNSLTTSNRMPTLSGTVTDASAVVVAVQVSGVFYPAMVSGSTWSASVTASLGDNTYEIEATATDAAGNVGNDGSSNELNVTGMAPTVALIPLVTKVQSPQLSGTATSGLEISSVLVTVNETTYTAMLSGSTWMASVTDVLPEARYSVTISVTDAGAQTSQETFPNGLVVDVSGPALTVDTLISNSPTPALSGTVSDLTELSDFSVVVDGANYTPTVTDGRWAIVVSQALSDGVYDVAASARDAVENLGADATANELTVDTLAPTMVIGPPSSIVTMSGPIVYALSYEGADTVNLERGDVSLIATGTATGTVSVADGNTNTPTVTIGETSGDGTLGIIVDAGTASDNAGNSTVSSSPSATFTVDNTMPALVIGAPSVSVTTGTPVSFQLTYSGTDSVDLTVEDVQLETTGTVMGVVSVSNEMTDTPTVTIGGISGYGTFGIRIDSGTALDSAGNVSMAAGPSGMVEVVADCLAIAAADNIVYVSTVENGGSDVTGDGTVTKPWATIAVAMDRIADCAAELNPVTIQLGADTYEEAVVLSPFVSIMGVDASDNSRTVIAPTVDQILANPSDGSPTAVIAGNRTALSDLSIQLPVSTGSDWRVLSINGVIANVTNVDFDGRNIQGSVGVLLSGLDTSESSITGCNIHNVEFGIRALETNASIRRTRFESIEEDALFVVEPTGQKGAASTAVPDMGDVDIDNVTDVGGNVFIGGDSIGGNFINNRNGAAELKAEGNDFGTDDRDEIRTKVAGGVDFEPRRATGNLVLVFTLSVSVRDAATSGGVSGATVLLDPMEGTYTELAGGNYLFPALPFTRYTVDVSAANYQSTEMSLTNPDLIADLLVNLDSIPVIGEGEGEGELPDIAQDLIDAFDSTDTDNDDRLSFPEASGLIGDLTQAQFEKIDTDSDGFITQSELAAQVGAGEGEGEGGVTDALVVTPTRESIDGPGGTLEFMVSNSGSGSIAWTVELASGEDFLTIASGTSGTNAGTIVVEVVANPDMADREGMLLVRDNTNAVDSTISIMQSGTCTGCNCPDSGCNMSKDGLKQGLEKVFGDLFLLGAAMVTLLGFHIGLRR